MIRKYAVKDRRPASASSYFVGGCLFALGALVVVAAVALLWPRPTEAGRVYGPRYSERLYPADAERAAVLAEAHLAELSAKGRVGPLDRAKCMELARHEMATMRRVTAMTDALGIPRERGVDIAMTLDASAADLMADADLLALVRARAGR